MNVVKLGGSLSSSGQLLSCLARAATSNDALVLVPGGGAFANQVRMAQHDWRFNDDIAHSMALLAMQQTALLLKGLEAAFIIAASVAQIRQELAKGHKVIWSPTRSELDQAGIPATWAITSDSLAAWLAGQLAADELVLVKAATLPKGMSLAEMAEAGIIDAGFCTLIHAATFKTTVINATEFTGPTVASTKTAHA